jgi:hypothetical protein
MALTIDPSAGRKFRKTGIWTRPIGRPRKSDMLNMFYGYLGELVAEWCCVVIATAYAYRTRRLKSSRPAAKLFRPNPDRIVLTPEWRGWFVIRNEIVDPEGIEPPRNLIRNYFPMLRHYRGLAGWIGDAPEIARLQTDSICARRDVAIGQRSA